MPPPTWVQCGPVTADGNPKFLTKRRTALAVHRGILWCAMTASDGKLFALTLNPQTDKWTARGQIKGWGEDDPWTTRACCGPALVDLKGTLHLVYSDYHGEDGKLFHLRYNDDKGAWGDKTKMPDWSTREVSLAAYKDQLVCAYTSGDGLDMFSSYWQEDQGWSKRQNMQECALGSHGFCVTDDKLSLVFGSANDARDSLQKQFNGKDNDWTRVTGPSQCTKNGYSADSYSNKSYVAFTAKNDSRDILICEWQNGQWSGNDLTVNSSTFATPAIHFYNAMAICVWNNAEEVLTWAKRHINYGEETVVELKKWMHRIADHELISTLSIPGTHDSGTCGGPPHAACQDMTIDSQLLSGIRYFDIRLQYYDGIGIGGVDFGSKGFHIHHAFIPFGLWKDVCQAFYSFLDANPSEGLLVQIKAENKEDDDFESLFKQETTDSRWRYDDNIPTMGELRGRIQLLRRFTKHSSTPFGVNVGLHWNKNGICGGVVETSSVSPTSGTSFPITIQDHWTVSEANQADPLDVKMSEIEQLWNGAAATPDQKAFYINYTSCTIEKGVVWWPALIARGAPRFYKWSYMANEANVDGINGRLIKKIRKYDTARLGCVVMDFPNSQRDLISEIVRTNRAYHESA